MKAYNGEKHHHNAQALCRKGNQFGIRSKNTHHPVGEEHTHNKAESSDAGCIDYRQFQSLDDTGMLSGSEVITRNGLHSLVQSHYNHYDDKYQPVDNAESADSQIAAILFQSLIDKDYDEACRHIHQERRHADSQ